MRCRCFIKQGRALFGILPGLDSAEFRRLLVEDHRFDSSLREYLQDIATSLSDQRIRKKISVADNNA